MTYEDISFNEQWVSTQSLNSFCKHEKHHGLSRGKMKEIYQLCKAITEKASFNNEAVNMGVSQ